jgi:16S rRNA (guanine966-N2)-methyltransferase
MRVIAGKFRGRPLRSMRGMDVRPSADRLRETLFDVLTAGNPAAMEGTVWLDLYAGTGAVGIEALSRGAGMVYFVESSREAAGLVSENLRSLGITEGCQVLRLDVLRALEELENQGTAADFIFLDPPYRMEEAYRNTLGKLGKTPMLRPGGRIIAEHQKRFDPGDEFEGLNRYRVLKQGDAALSFYKKSS